MQAGVETGLFDSGRDADGGDAVDQPEHREGERERPDRLANRTSWVSITRSLYFGAVACRLDEG